MPTKKPTEKSPLEHKPKSGWDMLQDKEARIDGYGRDYIRFLSEVKTEREAVSYIRERAAQDKNIIVVGRHDGQYSGEIIAGLISVRNPLPTRPIADIGSTLAQVLMHLAQRTHLFGSYMMYGWRSSILCLRTYPLK